jgi:hypothetical protein
MSCKQWWRVAHYLLFAAFLGTAALNMLRIRGGFFTNYAADLAVPAWLYVASRGSHSLSGRQTFLQRAIGRTPELAALSLFIASALTEFSQLIWPHGFFAGRFDPLDIAAYASGLAVCYAADKTWGGDRNAGVVAAA